ncbi:MAG: type II toxin-antitoxin system VapC family toxin [Puniceicoccaceae bacterium]|nr:MAG: type II toxin-antitoxin system VapC family toxin [Puniceicoccaceae bacterium]
MSWVVDTCVLIDILEGDSEFGPSSALCLREYLSGGLVVSPVTMIELSPAFEGNFSKQKEFLSLCGVNFEMNMEAQDVANAHAAWNRYIGQKRLKNATKRPIADIMIGAFAVRFDGLITRNPKDFRPWFPGIHLVIPA